MTATEMLHRLLDERGVEYEIVPEDMYGAREFIRVGSIEILTNGRDEVAVYYLTPEQAVEATLGRGECSNKAIRPQTFWCDQCDCAAEGWVDVGGTLINGFRYCPNCGRKVVDA